MYWQFGVYLLYGIPSALLNILLGIFIRRTKLIKESSFYRVYSFVLFVYLLTYLNTYVTLKFWEIPAMIPLYVNVSSFIPFRPFFTFKYAAFHIQQHSLILMHLNRFTAIWLPLLHYKIWRPFHFRAMMVAIFLFGFGICSEMFFITGYYVLSLTGYLSNPINRPLDTPICYWAEMNLSHVYPVISFLLNMVSLAKLIYMRTVKKSQSAGKRMELNLFLICLASLAVQIALMFYVDYGVSLVDTEYRVFMLNIVSDFGTMSEGWIGIIVNRKLRQQFTLWLFSWKTIRLALIGYDPTTTDAYQRAYRQR